VPPGLSTGSRCDPQPYRGPRYAHPRNNPGLNLLAESAAAPYSQVSDARFVLVARRESSELPGEDLTTSVLPEVAGWISIYQEMAWVLRSVIARAGGGPEAGVLEDNLTKIEDRLAMWRERHAELAGVVIDRNDHMLTYAGKSLRLTRREAGLLDFLLRHPQRPFTSKQLATLAWQNSSLSEAQVRTYIMRLRSRLREVGLGEVITVVRNRGYGIAATLARGAD
jgi:DNA-binding winged helix-turn-helix (wHTH) protein